MDEKNIPVFDFTDERIFSDTKKMAEYYKLNGKPRENYETSEVYNKKISIKIVNIDGEVYKCIYKYRTVEDLYQKINKEPLLLKGIYLDDMNIVDLVGYKRNILNNFDASFSFLDGYVDFSYICSDKCLMKFYGTNFGSGVINFRGTNFSNGYMFFCGANFGKGDLWFDGANLSELIVRFDDAIFGKGNAIFAGVNFNNGQLSFTKTNFDEGDVDFSGANFNEGNVNFNGANFGKGNVSFYNVKFGAVKLQFDDAKFTKGNVRFELTNFREGDVTFHRTDFGQCDVAFDRSTFGESFMEFVKIDFSKASIHFYSADFNKATILFFESSFTKGDLQFSEANIRDLIFEKTKFDNNTILNCEFAHSVTVQNCIIEKILECSGTIQELSFAHTINLGHIYIELTENNLQESIENWKYIYESKKSNSYFEVDEAVKEFRKEMLNSFRYNTSEMVKKHNNRELASQFRMLKENFHNIGYYDDEDKAYRAYMKYKRKSLNGTSTIIQLIKDKQEKHFFCESLKRVWNSFKKAFYTLFGLVGGYGTQPGRVLATALGVIGIFGIGYSRALDLSMRNEIVADIIYKGTQLNDVIIKFAENGMFTTRFGKGIYFSAITFLTIGYGDIQPISPSMAFWAGVEGFLGLFLMSYFTVTIVRKLLR